MAAGSAVLRDLAGELRDVPFKAMLPTIKQIKAVAQAEGITMSLNGRRPAKLRAVDKRMPGKAAEVVVWRVQGVPVGPWVWQTTGTGAHTTRRRKRGPKRKMLVHHPGTSGRGRWARVEARAKPIVEAVFTDYVGGVIRG
jgi:hypothetical protein